MMEDKELEQATRAVAKSKAKLNASLEEMEKLLATMEAKGYSLKQARRKFHILKYDIENNSCPSEQLMWNLTSLMLDVVSSKKPQD